MEMYEYYTGIAIFNLDRSICKLSLFFLIRVVLGYKSQTMYHVTESWGIEGALIVAQVGTLQQKAAKTHIVCQIGKQDVTKNITRVMYVAIVVRAALDQE